MSHKKDPNEPNSIMKWQPSFVVAVAHLVSWLGWGTRHLTSGKLSFLIDGKQMVVLVKKIAIVALLKGLVGCDSI